MEHHCRLSNISGTWLEKLGCVPYSAWHTERMVCISSSLSLLEMQSVIYILNLTEQQEGIHRLNVPSYGAALHTLHRESFYRTKYSLGRTSHCKISCVLFWLQKTVVYSCSKMSRNKSWSQDKDAYMIAKSQHPPSVRSHSLYSSWHALHPLCSGFLSLLVPTSSFSLFYSSMSVHQGCSLGGLCINLGPPGLQSQIICDIKQWSLPQEKSWSSTSQWDISLYDWHCGWCRIQELIPY